MKITRLLAIALAFSMAAGAATIAVVDDGGGAGASHSNHDLAGFRFSSANTLTISALGIWAGTSLSDDHFVGIYDLDGNLQVSATVQSDVSPDAQGYSYVVLNVPHVLAAGTWFIGAYYNAGSADLMRDFGAAPTMASGLTFESAAVYFSGSGFDPVNPALGASLFVESNANRGSYFGPNFQFEDVPEPGTFATLTVGLVLLAARLRRKVGAGRLS